MVDKIQILTTCSNCNGKAYLPTDEEIFIAGWKYFRHEPCSVCQGSGKQIRWIDLNELARLLDKIAENKQSHRGIL